MRTSHTASHSFRQSRVFRGFFTLLLVLAFAAPRGIAQTTATANTSRLIVQDSLGLNGVLNLCILLNCSTVEAIGDPQGQVFMIETPASLPLVSSLLNLLGLVAVETDQSVFTEAAIAGATPSYLTDTTPVTYYGATVWQGYVDQTPNQLVRTSTTQATFGVTGSGVIVADIDTGVDPNNPVMKSILLPGYDFTRNQSGGSEMNDVSQPSSTNQSTTETARVSQSTVAVLDQSTVAVLDGGPYAAFGHGTMTAGIIHLVAPQAQILPLKAFTANGTGYDSDILRAIYYAVGHGAKVINMSFNYTSYSQQLADAVNYATENGVICVAAAGNSGEDVMVYPGGLKNVIDVASTSNDDTASTFSNYGAPPVWLAAPGEGVMTTYPYGTYAAGWGTSFSTPFVTGETALLVSMASAKASSGVSLSIGSLLNLSLSLQGSANLPNWEPQAAKALAHAQSISDPQMGNGRLDTYQATQAWVSSLGLN